MAKHRQGRLSEEIKKSIAGIAELMGVEPMLEAYYAGVPVEDVIA